MKLRIPVAARSWVLDCYPYILPTQCYIFVTFVNVTTQQSPPSWHGIWGCVLSNALDTCGSFHSDKERVKYVHDLMCDYRRGSDWWMYLLTIYTHDSKLQALKTAQSLISTLYKSPHPKPSPACSVFSSRCLITALNNGEFWASVLTSLLSDEYPTTASLLKSKSKLFYDGRFAANQFVLASSPLRITVRIFFSIDHLLS
jgi:hypothetical protein